MRPTLGNINMLDWLFDTSIFVTRDHCGPGWTKELIFFSNFCDFFIWISYFSIPVSLFWWYWYKKHKIPTSWMVILFVLFIFFCGCTHLNEILVFTWPAYRYFVFTKALTALLSTITAITLPFTLLNASRYKTPLDYISVIDERDKLIIEKDRLLIAATEARQQLELRINELEDKRKHKDWFVRTSDAITNLKRIQEGLK